MLRLLTALLAVGLSIYASGCATNVVVIDSRADVVRLGGNVKGNVYVYQGGNWVLCRSVRLPEGWYAGPGPQD